MSNFFSHPNKRYENHISNMILDSDTELERDVKLFHDIGKLKENFQRYVLGERNESLEKDHSLVSAYVFLANSQKIDKETLIGIISILSHHGSLKEPDKISNVFCRDIISRLKKGFNTAPELKFLDEVVDRANELPLYKNLNKDKDVLLEKAKELFNLVEPVDLSKVEYGYDDYILLKNVFSNLIYHDKHEAIFSKNKEITKPINSESIRSYISLLEKNSSMTFRQDFRKKVLSGFDKGHRLYTITAPTGYGKTLTSLEFATMFSKERIIYALPFTSIIDQTYDLALKLFKKELEYDNNFTISKVHHKTSIAYEQTEDGEEQDRDRYSKIKFLTESFSGNINVTTLYRLAFSVFGRKNSDGVKYNQLKNSVVIVDEIQAFPTRIRQDFIKACEKISVACNTVFIFMSATMPCVSTNFKELSDIDFFHRQNRYTLRWFNGNDEELIKKISEEAITKNTLVVVNTKKKAQELFKKFEKYHNTYHLSSTMYDDHKRKTIAKIADELKNNKPVLLISTQSIEAGVDLSFDVGFREIAPISSIVQVAGRVNRHFGEKGDVYVFGDLSGFSHLIYFDELIINQNFVKEVLSKNPIDEKHLYPYIADFFETSHKKLESNPIERYIRDFNFRGINSELEKSFSDNGSNYKQTIIIEDEIGFIENIENELLNIKNNKDINKYTKRDMIDGVIKKLFSKAISISKKELSNCNLNKRVKGLEDVFYISYNEAISGLYDKKLGWVLDIETFSFS